MKGLTQRQQEILEFLGSYFKRQGSWPSIRDIQFTFQFKSTNAVIGHLRALERKGYIKRISGQARTYQILWDALQDNTVAEEEIREEFQQMPDAMEVTSIPVYGSIAAGYPDHVESTGVADALQIDVDTMGPRSYKTFALRVRGDSMQDADIHEGDTVILDVKDPQDGDIVAALIDGETTLKRFMQTQGRRPYLRAENKNYPDLIPADELFIQGVAKAVLRAL